MTLNKQSSMTVTFSKLKVIGWNPTINKSCYFQICLTMNTLICYTATKKTPTLFFSDCMEVIASLQVIIYFSLYR